MGFQRDIRKNTPRNVRRNPQLSSEDQADGDNVLQFFECFFCDPLPRVPWGKCGFQQKLGVFKRRLGLEMVLGFVWMQDERAATRGGGSSSHRTQSRLSYWTSPVAFWVGGVPSSWTGGSDPPPLAQTKKLNPPFQFGGGKCSIP